MRAASIASSRSGREHIRGRTIPTHGGRPTSTSRCSAHRGCRAWLRRCTSPAIRCSRWIPSSTRSPPTPHGSGLSRSMRTTSPRRAMRWGSGSTSSSAVRAPRRLSPSRLPSARLDERTRSYSLADRRPVFPHHAAGADERAGHASHCGDAHPDRGLRVRWRSRRGARRHGRDLAGQCRRTLPASGRSAAGAARSSLRGVRPVRDGRARFLLVRHNQAGSRAVRRPTGPGPTHQHARVRSWTARSSPDPRVLRRRTDQCRRPGVAPGPAAEAPDAAGQASHRREPGRVPVRHRPAGGRRNRFLRSLTSVPRFLALTDAIAEYVHNGDTVAMEGFTHLIPFTAGHEVIRQGRRNLTLVRMTPDLIYDQLIGMGCARKLIFSWGGNPGVGSLHRLRDAVENGWPQPLELEEHSHAGIATAYAAGAAGLPLAILRRYVGADLPGVNPNIRFIEDPFTGVRLAAIPSLRPDVSIVHAQRADRAGNVLLEGIVGVQKEAVLAATRAVVTVEEVVDDLRVASPNSVVLPSWTIDAIVEAPGGARPSYAHGYYWRDNAFYTQWDAISRERETFLAWMNENVLRKSSSPSPPIRGRRKG